MCNTTINVNISNSVFCCQIVETMSYTENVANFLGSLGSFYDNVPVEDLELLIGNVIERVRSQPGSPLSGSPFGKYFEYCVTSRSRRKAQ